MQSAFIAQLTLAVIFLCICLGLSLGWEWFKKEVASHTSRRSRILFFLLVLFFSIIFGLLIALTLQLLITVFSAAFYL